MDGSNGSREFAERLRAELRQMREGFDRRRDENRLRVIGPCIGDRGRVGATRLLSGVAPPRL